MFLQEIFSFSGQLITWKRKAINISDLLKKAQTSESVLIELGPHVLEGVPGQKDVHLRARGAHCEFSLCYCFLFILMTRMYRRLP